MADHRQVYLFRFDQQLRFKRPQFIQEKMVINEEAVRVAIDVNICMILNRLMGPDCIYSRRPTHTTDVPDFNCHRAELLILVIGAKRKHVLEDMGEQTFPEFYHTSKGKDVV
ncbi:hypothetical protein RhiirA4_446424 [Rhizophagus irregularis]|uniref:Uncharacterized protein n=1 Tax=Rhizophagus irregularis TaxID=588596 RepID=A0A2I1GV70_9GLOM|nr:hypothetical protein RhiirA4_446424 [Rhizophagus irregularis]